MFLFTTYFVRSRLKFLFLGNDSIFLALRCENGDYQWKAKVGSIDIQVYFGKMMTT